MFNRFFWTEEQKTIQAQADEIVELFKDSPEVAERKRQREAEVQAQRRAAHAEIQAAEKEKSERLPAAAQALIEAQRQVDEAESTLAARKVVLMHAQMDRFGIAGELDLRINRARGILRRTEWPEIAELELWLHGEHEQTRRKIETAIGTRQDIFGATKIVKTNSRSITKRVEAIRKAFVRSEELRFELVEDITAEIAAIKASIPPADYLSKTVEAPVPRIEAIETERYGELKQQRLPEKQVIWQQ